MNFLKARILNKRNWIIVMLILDWLILCIADVECTCTCNNGISPCDLFEAISHINKDMKLFNENISQLGSHQHQLTYLNRKNAVNEDKIEKLEKQWRELKKSSFRTTTTTSLPVTEPLTNLPEEYTEVNSEKETLHDGEQELASLRAKVEVLENKSIEVQEELRSERRVRRHIQENLAKTQTYIRLLDTNLHNMTVPVDNRVNQIEEVISKLENLNKTFVENYLKELEYKINDVAYKNETRKLSNRLEEIEHHILDPENSTLISKIESKLKILSNVLKNLNDSIEKKISVSEYRILETIDNNFKNELENFRNESNSLRNDFEEIQIETKAIVEIVSENKDKMIDISQEARILSNQVSSAFGELDDIKREFAGLQVKIANISTIDDLDINSENKYILTDLETPCLLPNITDSKLVADIYYDDNGTQYLIFECHPRSHYVIAGAIAAMKCKDGIWQGKVPYCSRILDETETARLSRMISNSLSRIEHPCSFPSGLFPNPLHCKTYFECSDGLYVLQICPRNQSFNPYSSKCDHYVRCTGYSVFDEVKYLIPSVILPNSVDRIDGLMGIRPPGELVVYPGTNFELKCLFPEGPWPKPKWTKDGLKSDAQGSILKNGVSLKVWNAQTSDTGIYSCVSPYSSRNYLRIVVKAIQCPVLEPGQIPKGVSVSYGPHPEGHPRILGTPIKYRCDRSKPSFTGRCRATGQWSRKPPSLKECESREGP